MTELRFEPGGRGLVATREQLDALADPPAAAAPHVAELERVGLLRAGLPVDDVKAIADAWSTPLATIRLLLRRDGAELVVTGVVDDYVAVLLTPVAPGSEFNFVAAIAPAGLPRQIAKIAGLGLRAAHPDSAEPVPLSWAAVDGVLGRTRSDDGLLRETRELAEPLATAESIDAVLASPATRWTATTAGTENLTEGTIDHQIDVLDPGPAGLWLIVAVPPDELSAAAIPVTTEQVWQLLGSILAVRPAHEIGAEAGPGG